MIRRLPFIAIVFALGISSPSGPERRWVFVHSQLAAPGGVERVVEIMERAAKVGCNGIVLTEDTLSGGRDPSEAEVKRAETLLEAGRRLGIEIIPTVCGPRAVLRHDVNLVEAMQVRDALFTVENGLAVHEPDPMRPLANGGFDRAASPIPDDWRVQQGSARVAVDNVVKHGGTRSLKIAFDEGVTHTAASSANVIQEAVVTPHRQYALTVWTRSDGFRPAANFQAWIMTKPDRPSDKAKPLAYTQWRQTPGSAWQAQHAVFNSLDNRRVTIRLQAWSAHGVLWVDTVSLNEVGLLNLVRRDGCPFVVRGENGTVYEEGRDFEPVADRRTGRSGAAGAYSAYHEPPEGIRLTADTRIGPTERLRVSYYHCPVVFSGRVAVCMSEPKVYDLIRHEIRRVNRLLRPRVFFMSHDEIRIVGWCALCAARKQTAGELLADNVKRCAQIIREESPRAEIAVWSDMFDPHHNARDGYYLAKGTLAGSWEGLPRPTIIANWNYNKRAQSLKWFSDRGHPQVIAGYYDRPVADVALWQAAVRGIPGIEGIMYTTWVRKYDDLEAFAKMAWD